MGPIALLVDRRRVAPWVMTSAARLPIEGVESIALADGDVVTLRPITPADSAALVEFHRLLSDRTVFLRYFYPHRALGADEVDHLTRLDGRDRFALVVERAGQLVAVGRYDRSPGRPEAEVAFVVADAFQHRGLGTILLQRLARAARVVGLTTFSAEVLTENSRMLALFHESGFPTRSSVECGTVHLQMAIGDEPDVQAGTLQLSPVPPPSGS
jgi:GNAT superfamily N-acetyltransferase